jgi:hypothetical protein
MGLARTLLRRWFSKRATVWLDRLGRGVGRWVDTSADAPEAAYQPKRDVYRNLGSGKPR